MIFGVFVMPGMPINEWVNRESAVGIYRDSTTHLVLIDVLLSRMLYTDGIGIQRGTCNIIFAHLKAICPLSIYDFSADKPRCFLRALF